MTEMTEEQQAVYDWLKESGDWHLPEEIAKRTRLDRPATGEALATLTNAGDVLMRREPGTARIYKFAAI